MYDWIFWFQFSSVFSVLSFFCLRFSHWLNNRISSSCLGSFIFNHYCWWPQKNLSPTHFPFTIRHQYKCKQQYVTYRRLNFPIKSYSLALLSIIWTFYFMTWSPFSLIQFNYKLRFCLWQRINKYMLWNWFSKTLNWTSSFGRSTSTIIKCFPIQIRSTDWNHK